MSVTGPQIREWHSSGVENSSRIGFLPRTWLNDTECICSGGVRVVSRPTLPCVLASVSVAIAGGRCPTSGIGQCLATATSPVALSSPFGVLVRETTS